MGNISSFTDFTGFYLEQLIKYGENGLLQRIADLTLLNLHLDAHPEYILLDQSEAFLKLSRRTGKEDYAILAKILRRAAHVIYRELIKQNKSKPDFKRFLNAV